jgi:hypothetical protein
MVLLTIRGTEASSHRERIVYKKWQFDSEGKVIEAIAYDIQTERGDGTVPLISAERIKYGTDLNAQNAVRCLFTPPSVAKGAPPPSDEEEAMVEHNGLTKNPKMCATTQGSIQVNVPRSTVIDDGLKIDSTKCQ